MSIYGLPTPSVYALDTAQLLLPNVLAPVHVNVVSLLLSVSPPVLPICTVPVLLFVLFVESTFNENPSKGEPGVR